MSVVVPVLLHAKSARQAGATAPRVELDRLLDDLDLARLEQAVARLEPGTERDYFTGMIASRAGRPSESAALLERVLPELVRVNRRRAAAALRTIGDDQVRLCRYRESAAAYDRLLREFTAELDAPTRKSVEGDHRAIRLLTGTAPQAVSIGGPVDVPTHRNRVIGTIDATLTVNGVTEAWILDTGANFSTVSASLAHRMGLTLSTETAQTQGITGAENALHTAVIPELKLGAATLRHVVVLVLDDASLNVPTGPSSHYQIHAVLGFPVFEALERVTFTADGHLLAGPGSPSADGGARLFMNQLVPLVECTVSGRPVLFSFDTGADQSFFSARYEREFPDQFKGLTKRAHGMGGAGGVRRMMAYFLPSPTLGVGPTEARLENVPVVPALGTDADKVFGNLGRDLTERYRRFTIDFGAMRFLLGEPRS